VQAECLGEEDAGDHLHTVPGADGE
jgi:hypothetical protein